MPGLLGRRISSLLGQYHTTHHGPKGRVLIIDADGDDDDDDDDDDNDDDNQLPSHGKI